MQTYVKEKPTISLFFYYILKVLLSVAVTCLSGCLCKVSYQLSFRITFGNSPCKEGSAVFAVLPRRP